MYLEVKKFPESQEVMNNPDWFFITDNLDKTILGYGACARIINNDIKDLNFANILIVDLIAALHKIEKLPFPYLGSKKTASEAIIKFKQKLRESQNN